MEQMSVADVAKGCGVALNRHQRAANAAWIKDTRDSATGSGRTTYLALDSIRQAVNTPGKSIELLDHFPESTGRALLPAVRAFAQQLEQHLRASKGSFELGVLPARVTFRTGN